MREELRAELMELGKQVAKSVGLFVLGLLLGLDASGAFFLACVPYGWSCLNRITPNVFLWMPFVGWLMYFILKVALAAAVGAVAMAVIWIKCIARVVIAYGKQRAEA